jgi:branched-chain amino acid transport system substrate-binding protein
MSQTPMPQLPTKKVIGRTMAAILMIVLLAAGIGAGVLAGSLVVAPALSSGLKGDVPIGDLLPLSGDLASFGKTSQASTEFARDDVNAYLSAAGAGWDIKLVEEDTATLPSQALSMVQTLFAQGVKVAVGPQSSGEVRQIKDYVNTNHIVLISQSSTATDLGIANDYVFRFAPNDTFQGLAIGRAMRNSGAITTVQMYRNDAWGVGLGTSSATAFTSDGGTVWGTKIAYDPTSGATGTAIATNTAALEGAVAAALASPSVNGNATKLAVQLLAFDEGTGFLHEAGSNPSAYPTLNNPKLKWFGSDGTAQSSKITADSGASAFSQKQDFLNTIFASTTTPKFANLQQRLTTKLGAAPEVYSYAAYDAVWVLALALQAAGKYDPVAVQKILTTSYTSTATAPYSGASGPIVLNSEGDRAFSDYDLWNVQGSGSTWSWVRVGKYNYATDSISTS